VHTPTAARARVRAFYPGSQRARSPWRRGPRLL